MPQFNVSQNTSQLSRRRTTSPSLSARWPVVKTTLRTRMSMRRSALASTLLVLVLRVARCVFLSPHYPLSWYTNPYIILVLLRTGRTLGHHLMSIDLSDSPPPLALFHYLSPFTAFLVFLLALLSDSSDILELLVSLTTSQNLHFNSQREKSNVSFFCTRIPYHHRSDPIHDSTSRIRLLQLHISR